MSTQLQEIIGEFKCNVLNYTKNRIEVDHFYSEERYNDFLKGVNCRAGIGIFDIGEVLEFNKLNDNTLVIIQKDGIETTRYKYISIFKATMEYKDKTSYSNKVNKTLTFRMRKSVYDGKFNLISEVEGKSLDFYSVQAVKKYLNQKYGPNKLIEWSVYVG